MNKRQFPESELIINADGSCFHLHLKPEQLADKIILVGDPARVNTVADHFDTLILINDTNTNRNISNKLKELGFTYVSLDLDGYKTGSLNKKINKD